MKCAWHAVAGAGAGSKEHRVRGKHQATQQTHFQATAVSRRSEGHAGAVP